MRHWVLMAAVLVACEKKPPPQNELEAFERKYVAEYEALAKAMRAQGKEVADKDIPTNYRAVYVGRSGVFVDRKLVAALPELRAKHADLMAALDANAALLPTIGYTGLSVTFDLGPEPASTAIEALRLFANRATYFSIRRDDPEVPLKASQILCGNLKLRDTPSANREAAQLSVFLDKGHAWVGVSRINEFYDIPDIANGRDLEKLKTVLREHKSSSLFADRTDIELAASAGNAEAVLGALETACNEGFMDIALLAPDQLSARPNL